MEHHPQQPEPRSLKEHRLSNGNYEDYMDKADLRRGSQPSNAGSVALA